MPIDSGATILVRDRRQLQAATAAAAALAMPVWLRTAPGLAAACGMPVIRAMFEDAGALTAAPVRALIDCDDRPGLAFAAIRSGLPYILGHGNAEGMARAGAIARLVGGGPVEERACRPLLDLSGCADPGSVCRAWLHRWRQRLEMAARCEGPSHELPSPGGSCI
jgi:hypothetical protein